MSAQEFVLVTNEPSTDNAAQAKLPRDAQTVDAGLIRMGAGCRIRALTVRAKQTADSGRIRMGAGCRIRVQPSAKRIARGA